MKEKKTPRDFFSSPTPARFISLFGVLYTCELCTSKARAQLRNGDIPDCLRRRARNRHCSLTGTWTTKYASKTRDGQSDSFKVTTRCHVPCVLRGATAEKHPLRAPSCRAGAAYSCKQQRNKFDVACARPKLVDIFVTDRVSVQFDISRNVRSLLILKTFFIFLSDDWKRFAQFMLSHTISSNICVLE